MILTDIYVPAVNQKYEFLLDESAPAGEVTLEIVRILQMKTGGRVHGTDRRGTFVLCSIEKEQLLDAGLTLHECGVRDGSRLLLV